MSIQVSKVFQKIIGQRIRYYRYLREMTQEALAEHIGVTKQHLGYIERGGSYPSLDLLVRASYVLNVEPINFLLRTNDSVSLKPSAGKIAVCGIWTIDLKSGREVWSSNIYRILKQPISTTASLETFLKKVHKIDVERIKRLHAQILRGNKVCSISCSIHHNKGVNRTLQIEPDLIRNRTGQAIYASMTIFDVTDWYSYRFELEKNQTHLENQAMKATHSMSRMLDELKKSRDRYRLVSDLISDYAYSFKVKKDNSFTNTWIAGGFEKVTGYSLQGEQLSVSWTDLIHPDDMQSAMQRQEILLSGYKDVREFRIIRKDGQVRWLQDHAYPVWDTSCKRIVEVYGAARDVTERKMAEQKTLFLSQRDELTGLWNRKIISEMVRNEVAKFGRYQKPCCILIAGIDEFRRINSSHGHLAGDQVIIHFSQMIKSHLRRVDMAGRFSGKEFMFILPETESKGALSMTERLRKNIREIPVHYGGVDISYTVSMGLVTINDRFEDHEHLLSQALHALYEAQRSGGNTTFIQ